MKAEIISIGSELTSGQNLDTNCQWLSQRLAEEGITIGWHTTIADDLQANVEAFRIASTRAVLVVMTGGLGPTQDDLTREALAQAAGVELVFDAPSFEHIQSLFAQRGRHMPERNRVQALFPAGAEPLFNERGTAPGIWMKLGNAQVAALPGVPSEMRAMFQAQVLPRLKMLGLSSGVLIQRKINAFGAGESTIEEKLLDLTRRGQVPEVGITASDATISLRILARAASKDEARGQIAPVERTIRERLGNLVYGEEEQELEEVVAQLLGEHRRTLAVAEGVTGGALAHRLVRVPGISAWFRGGIVAYDNALKVDLLGVPRTLLEEKGAASPEVVEALAIGCRTRLGVDLALSTVGFAGPDNPAFAGQPEGSAGRVHVGLAWQGGVRSVSFHWPGTRREVLSRTAKLALNLVRLHLLSGGGHG
jgi:nicotinamide-nucleotide amidase